MKRETSFIAQLYVFVWLLVLPIGAYAQGNKVSLKCSNMALTSALLEVEKQSGYYKINYNSGELSAYKVTVTIQNLTPPAAVNRLLTDLPFRQPPMVNLFRSTVPRRSRASLMEPDAPSRAICSIRTVTL